MPAINLPTINIGEGDFKSKETMENILDTLMKYRKELNYLLMNLDVDNMPVVGGLIGDIEGNYSLLSQTVNGITMQVGNIQGDISSLQIQANAIIASVGDNTGAIASLVLTAQGLQSQVNDNAGNISTLTQTASGLQSQVTNNAGNISTLTQTASGLQSQVSSINTTLGNQSSQITQLSNSISTKVSQTDYNGVNIVSLIEQTASSIKLSASKIDLTGITRVYATSGGGFMQMGPYGILIDPKFHNETFSINHDGITGWDIGANATGGINIGIGCTTHFPNVVFFNGGVDFTRATISGLTLRFA